MNRTQTFILLSSVAVSCGAIAGGDATAGKSLYQTCLACHGVNGEGNQALHAPKLSGQADWYLIRQLSNFKTGIRGTDPKDTFGMQMNPMAGILADEQAVQNVVAYIETLADKPAPPTVTGNADKGKSLYGTCLACHGAKAEGNKELNAPRLAGMSDWYLVTQLKNFKAGIRGKHPQDLYGQQMIPMAQTLPDDQAIMDVVAYINTFR
jgi:Cytochrome c553